MRVSKKCCMITYLFVNSRIKGDDIDNIEGDSYTGSDLTAGASKTWKLLIMPKPKAVMRTFKLDFNEVDSTEVPIIWQE